MKHDIKSKDSEYNFVGKIVKCIWNTNDFKVYAINVDKNKYPKIIQNKYGNVSILGELPDLTVGVEYQINGVINESKNGIGYKVLNIKRDIPSSKEEMLLFLKEILTENQANVLWEHYPDIVQRVKENRLGDIDLNKLKGIKEYTFNIIVEKITENFPPVRLNFSIIKEILGAQI